MTQEDLLPCPFCGGENTQIYLNKGVFNGRGYGEPISVEIRHWCSDVQGHPSRMIVRIGKDEPSAIKQWNKRAKS